MSSHHWMPRDGSDPEQEPGLDVGVPSYVPEWLFDVPAPESPAVGLQHLNIPPRRTALPPAPAPPPHPSAEIPAQGAREPITSREAPPPPRRARAARGTAAFPRQVRLLRAIWVGVFLATVFVPLALVSDAGAQPQPGSRGGIAIELSMITGLLGLSLIAATVVLPSRMRSISRAFGIDHVVRSHRLLALAATGVVLAHIGVVLADTPANVHMLNPVTGPPPMLAGMAATLALVALCWLSLGRLGIRHETWRVLFGILAVLAVGGTYLHIILLHHLVRNLPERAVLFAILALVIAMFGNRWLLRPVRARRAPYVIQEIRPESPSTSTLVLAPSRKHQRRLRYCPGQFAWIRLDSPVGPLQGHPVTIAPAPDDDRNLQFTIRLADALTDAALTLSPGRRVFVDGPYQDFDDEHLDSRSLLLVAAGAGVTPAMSILRAHAHRRDARPHVLLVGGRYPDELVFADELRHLSKLMSLDVVRVVSVSRPSWTGRTGRIDQRLLRSVIEARPVLWSASVIVCGPAPMMSDTWTALVDLGIDDRQIHTTQFDLSA